MLIKFYRFLLAQEEGYCFYQVQPLNQHPCFAISCSDCKRQQIMFFWRLLDQLRNRLKRNLSLSGSVIFLFQSFQLLYFLNLLLLCHYRGRHIHHKYIQMDQQLIFLLRFDFFHKMSRKEAFHQWLRYLSFGLLSF